MSVDALKRGATQKGEVLCLPPSPVLILGFDRYPSPRLAPSSHCCQAIQKAQCALHILSRELAVKLQGFNAVSLSRDGGNSTQVLIEKLAGVSTLQDQ